MSDIFGKKKRSKPTKTLLEVPVLVLAFVIKSVVHKGKCHTRVFAATKGTLKSKEKRSKNDVMRIKEVKASSPTPANVFYAFRQFEVARETES